MTRKRSYRARDRHSASNINVWEAYTDLMSNAFLILVLFSFMILLSANSLLSRANSEEIENVQRLDQANAALARIQNELESLTEKNTALSSENGELRKRSRSDSLPVYEFPETKGYKFDTGSAEIPRNLRQQITSETAIEINKLATEKGIDTIEVIGHTDGETISGYTGIVAVDSDSALDNCLRTWPVRSQLCKPSSNTDLGMLRALSVVELLQRIQGEGKLSQELKFRAYSAGQLISPDEQGIIPAGKENDPTRRRIEIRLAPRTFNAQ